MRIKIHTEVELMDCMWKVTVWMVELFTETGDTWNTIYWARGHQEFRWEMRSSVWGMSDGWVMSEAGGPVTLELRWEVRLFLNKWHVLSYIHIPNRKWCLLRTFCYKKSKPACANHFPSTSTNSWLTLVHLSHPRSSSCYFEAQLRHIISTVIISVCISKR